MGHSKNHGRRRLTLPLHSRGAADSNGAVSQRLPTHVHPVAGPGVAASVRPTAPETETAEAAAFGPNSLGLPNG